MVLKRWPPTKKALQQADNQEVPNPFAKLNNTYNVVREYPETIATKMGPIGALIKQCILCNKYEFVVQANRFFST